ncbi:MAG: translation initiation factor IF-2 N-terminal domain-containing protein, partial [Syntrophaceae bacterium]|nr:translation initiation factor IF-2 N-terminal domain-containing protein [Syntrophaceae bacterium]
MTKKRVYELAKELGLENRELMTRMEKLGITVKSHSSTLEDGDVERIYREIRGADSREMEEKRITSTIIRRRVVRPTAEEEKIEAPAEVKPEGKAVPAAPKPEAKKLEKEALPREKKEEIRVPAEEEVVTPTKPAVPGKEPVIPAEKEAAAKEKPEPVVKTEEKEIPPESVQEEQPPAAAPKAPPIVGPRIVSLPEARKAQEPQHPPKAEAPRQIVPPRVTPPSGQEAPSRKAEPHKPAREGAPQVIERPAPAEEERGKKKRKTGTEAFTEEALPVKKKAFQKKVTDKKSHLIEIEREEKPVRWREEKKAAPIKMKKTQITTPKAIKRRIKVGEAITVGELAKKMGVKAGDVINKLMGIGLMASINQAIDFDAASLIAVEFGYQVETAASEFEEAMQKTEHVAKNLQPRAPVVT